MRPLLCVAFATALLALPLAVHAQTWSPSVNQRMTPPTTEADNYLGVSLGQLIMALGMTLQGMPPQGLDEIRLLRPHQTAAAPEPPASPVPVPAAALLPAAAPPALASPEGPLVPAVVEQPVKSPETH